MSKIRSRLIVIGLLFVFSVWQLLPKNETQRVPDPTTGRMKDTSVRRVPVHLGLDLQGGVHLALEVDQTKGPVPDCAEAIRRAERVVRTRIDEFGTTEPVVQIVGRCRLIVELAGEKDPSRAKGIIQRTAFLEFRITDMQNLFRNALPEMDAALRAAGVKGPAGGAANAVAKLFGDTGKKKAGPDTSLVNAPGALSSLLFQGQLAGEFLVQEENFAKVDSIIHMPQFDRVKPRGLDLFWGAQVESRGARPYRALYAVQNKAIITGEELTKATARRDQLTNQSVVEFTLTRRGGRKFGEETGRHVGDYMAIILDGRVQGRPPVIQSRIGRNGQITLGNKSLQEAQDLALTLKAGALPIPLKIVEERQVGASLGSDSIRDGITAGLVGTVFVIFIMVGYYRLSGVLAVLGLGLYILFTIGSLSMVEATL